MQIIDTPLHDVKIIRPKIHGDERGWFAEVFNANAFAAAGLPRRFVQDNQSFSRRGVLRGLHYQLGQASWCVRWNDPKLAIEWPIDCIGEPTVSAQDAVAPMLDDAELPASYAPLDSSAL